MLPSIRYYQLFWEYHKQKERYRQTERQTKEKTVLTKKYERERKRIKEKFM